MPLLTWISDANLINAVKNLVTATQAAKADALRKIEDNVMDPFSAFFQMSGFGMTYDEWIKSEEARQAQKTMQNYIGEFHQTILGHCNGWQNLNTGTIVDLVNANSQIVAEVKNKYSTVKASDLYHYYDGLSDIVMHKTSAYKGFTGYHVSIIPSKPVRYNIEFIPSNNTTGRKSPNNPLIRTIDGASFYTLVTGQQDALKDLFEVLPKVAGNFNAQQTADIAKLQNLYKLAYG